MWGIVPAAGIGQRFGASQPKQYEKLGQQRVIDHALQALMRIPNIKKIVVALAREDQAFRLTSLASSPKLIQCEGGRERCISVYHALLALKEWAGDEDWVWVHDAARPCLSREDIAQLLEKLATVEVGCVLGALAKDTMKSIVGSQIQKTEDRGELFHAFTPQIFKYGILLRALKRVCDSDEVVTDESEAVERLGLQPHWVAGQHHNIKITYPEDLFLAEMILAQLAEE